MNARDFRYSVIIQSPKGTRNAVGERVTTWTDVATVRAKIEPVTTNQRFVAAQANTEVSHRVTIRYSSDVSGLDGGWRVKFGSRILVVDGVRNLDERNRIMELVCKEGMTTE